MSFTGRIGTDLSYPGNIVLGIVDSFELASVGARVHVIGVREIRVVFDRSVNDSALNPNAYILSSISPVLSFTPVVQNVRFEDANEFSVILTTSDRMLYSAIYSMQVFGVFDKFGRSITSLAKNFSNDVQDPPIAIASFLSVRGSIDVLFDRPVGPHSSYASAFIRDPNTPSSDQPMILIPWAGANISENTIRFVYPVTTPTSDTFEIAFTDVYDISGNFATGVVPLSFNLLVPGPYNSSSLSQIQITDAQVVDLSFPVGITTLRVWFNGPVDRADALNTSLWTIYEEGPHLNEDPSGFITSPDPTGLSSSATMLNELKGRFNTHLVKETIHKFNDAVSTITLSDVVDLPEALNLCSVIIDAFRVHFHKFPSVHLYDDVSPLPLPDPPSDLPELINAVLLLKTAFDSHLSLLRPITFSTSVPVEIGPISSYADSSFYFPVDDESSWHIDLHVASRNPYSRYRVQVQVQSEDSGSVTDPYGDTGQIFTKPYFSDPYLKSIQSFPDGELRMKYGSPVSLFNGSVILPSGSHSTLTPTRVRPTIRNCFRTFNWFVFAYKWHISSFGAVHVQPESVAYVTSSDYATVLDENHLIEKVNNFSTKISYHLSNSVSHSSTPSAISFVLCDDIRSCFFLIEKMIQTLRIHNLMGDAPNSSYEPPIVPGNYGVHNAPGPVFPISNGVDVLINESRGILDGQVHSFENQIIKNTQNPFVDTYDRISNTVTSDFLGHSYKPSLSSAFSKNALVIFENGDESGGTRLHKDLIEVWFSKPMLDQAISISNINITGGSLVVEDINWFNDRTIHVQVRSMQEITYTLSVTGLFDDSGNPIY